MMSIDFEIVFLIYLRLSDQFNFSSIITPKNLVFKKKVTADGNRTLFIFDTCSVKHHIMSFF